MKIIDISWPITPDITAYKDRIVVAFTHTKKFESDHMRESVIKLGSHTGTHIDAPAHFLQDGITVDALPLEALCGPCTVIDCDAAKVITVDILKKHSIDQGMRLLFKTSNSTLSPHAPFDHTFVYLDADAAVYLATKRVKSVGIDYLGIERNQPHHETHITLMQSGIIIIEGLRLAHVDPGFYNLYCLPLAIIALEAAPARALLMRE